MIPQSPLSHPPVNYLQAQGSVQGIARHQPPSFDSPGPATHAAGVTAGMSPASSPVKTPYVPNGGDSYGFGDPAKTVFGNCQGTGSPVKTTFGPCQGNHSSTSSPMKQVNEGSNDGWGHGQYWRQGSYSGYGGYSEQNSDTSGSQGSQYQGYQGYQQ